MKRLKRFFTVLTVLFVLVLGAAVWAGYHFRGEIVPVVTAELNKQLKTPVHVDTIRVTFLKHFPKASVEFDGVTVLGSNPARKNDTLFQVGSLYLSFNLMDWYNGRLTLSEIEASRGFGRMHIASNGKSNFDFWESGSDTASSRGFQIDLEQVTLNNIDFELLDELRNNRYAFDVKQISGKGGFSDAESNIALYGSLTNKMLRLDNVRYLPGEDLKIDAGIEFNADKDFYRISRGLVTLRNRYQFTVNGRYSDRRYAWDFKGTNLDIAVIGALIPEQITGFFNDFQGKGTADIAATVKKDRNQNRPELQSTFTLRNGSLNVQDQKVRIADLYSTGTYADDLHRNKGGRLTIDSLHCNLNGEPFTGRINLADVKQPSFQLYAEHSNTFKAYQSFLKADTLQKLSGRFLAESYISGKMHQIDSLTLEHFIGFNKNIKLSFFDCNVQLKNAPWGVTQSAGSLRIKGTDVFADSLRGLFNKKPFETRGTWRNALRFIQGEEPFFRYFGSVRAERLVFYELFPADESDSSEFSLPDRLILDLKPFRAQNFIYDNIDIQRATGDFVMRPGRIQLNNLKAETMEGRIQGDVVITDSPKQVSAEGKVEDMNLSLFFKKFDNFGSKDLTSKNLKGRLTADFTAVFPLSFTGAPEFENTRAVADLTVKEGELIDYKPLQEVTSVVRENKVLNLFIKLDDFENRLKHIRFEELSNTVKIRDKTVFIPEMNIPSSALDIETGGSQKFSGELDYRLNFNIKEVLQKSKVKQTEYGYIKEESGGGKRVFFIISGTSENPVVKLDNKRSRAHSKEEFDRELQTTKSLLKEEFGLFKGDTSVPEPETEPEKQEMQIEFDPEGNYSDPKKPAEKEEPSEEETPKKRFFDKLKDKVSSDEEKDSQFDDWDFEDDDF